MLKNVAFHLEFSPGIVEKARYERVLTFGKLMSRLFTAFRLLLPALFLRDPRQLPCDLPHHIIGHAVHRPGLNAGVDAVVDIVHDDEFFEREGDFGREPVQSTDGSDALGDVVQFVQSMLVFILRRDDGEDVCQRMPPAGEGLSCRVERAEPGGLSVDGARGDRGLEQVFLFGEFQAGAQDLIQRGCAHDDALAAPAM